MGIVSTFALHNIGPRKVEKLILPAKRDVKSMATIDSLTKKKKTKDAIIEALKSSPVAGFYLRIPEKAKAIKDALFLDKLISFADGASELTEGDIEKIHQMSDPELSKAILHFIDAVNQPWKSRKMGVVFKNHIQGFLSESEMLCIFDVIDRMNEIHFEDCLALLNELKKDPKKRQQLYSSDVSEYLHHGLFSIKYRSQQYMQEINEPITEGIRSQREEEPAYFVASTIGECFFKTFREY